MHPTWTGKDLNPDHRGDRPTNRLKHGTARCDGQIFYLLVLGHTMTSNGRTIR